VIRALLPLVMVPCLVAGAAAAAGEQPCREPPGCIVDGGRYLALTPSGWDGTSPLPVMVFFHGWRESAEYVVKDPLLSDFATRRNILLIAPHGEGNTWSYPGAPGKHRDEFAFVSALAADIKARFPVDERRFAAAGFSQGASMVWNIACRMPGAFSAYGALAGGFWEPSPASCSGDGVDLIHVHGRNDATVPLAGRSLRGGLYRQADVGRDWRIWLEAGGCSEAPSAPQPVGGRECLVWSACGKRKALAMCLHDGGHNIHAPDLEAVWAFVEQRAQAR
jgi:polyhydroxybutyrate depolymerase